MLDDVLLHPVWGYAILLFVLFLFFEAVYGIGKLVEPPLLTLFDLLTRGVLSPFGANTLLSEIVLGIMQGIAAGVANRFTVSIAVSLWVGTSRRCRISAAHSILNGRADAPHRFARQGHCAIHSWLRM